MESAPESLLSTTSWAAIRLCTVPISLITTTGAGGSLPVPPPGSDPRGTRAPPPRPGSVPVPGGNPAADFETRSIEKEQLLQTVGDVVQQVKDHMSRPRVKGVTLGDAVKNLLMFHFP